MIQTTNIICKFTFQSNKKYKDNPDAKRKEWSSIFDKSDSWLSALYELHIF